VQGVALVDHAGMKEEEKDTGRIEAFSDGVFAIAITLLALELKIPHSVEGGAEGLVRALVNQWPSYLSFITSFCSILIMWGNHHEVFRLVRKTNTGFMLANGFLLMLVTVVPFTTALISDYLNKAGAVVACTVYGGVFVLISIAYNLLWYAAIKDRALLRSGVPEQTIRKFTRNYRLGFPLYLLATAAAFVSPFVTIGICTALWVFWAFTMRRGGTEILSF
jgi:uncharacterized membrane protein